MDVVDFAGHVIVAPNYIYFVLEEERLVADAQLVHRVQAAPGLTLHIEEVDLTVSIRVLSSNQDYLSRRNSQGRTCPKWILHTDGQDNPSVLVNIVNFNGVVDFLFGTTEEASKSVDKLVVNRACTQIMPFVLHHSHLRPFILLDLILLDRV